MRQSKLFTKTKKENPGDEISKNAQLLIRAGFVYKEMAGVYVYLPLGLRVLHKINKIIKEEMDAVGGQELNMSVLQNREIWDKTGRWSDEVVDNWFKTKLKNGNELGLGFTHEEALTNLVRDYVQSYKDLPFYPYQIQIKFRNELRAKSGIMRGREFLMKDMYSFSRDQKEHEEFYEKAKEAYKKIFDRLGIGDKTYLTFASGGSFAKYSHEFQTISDAGEDTIFVDEDKKLAVNQEVMSDEIIDELGLKKDNLKEVKAIEVGNIFSLGTKFSEPLGLKYADENGEMQTVIMGSYGIGPTRTMGTIVELLSDDVGMIWPENIAPFKVHLLNFKQDPKEAEILYQELQEKGIEVLFDDREDSPGSKLKDADLIGIPYRLIVSDKTDGKIEYKRRDSSEVKLLSKEEVFQLIS